MKIKEAEFVISAASPAQYPKDGLPEVALVGRSNVGKSSFINRMLGRKRLAHTSSRPGKTQMLNFYRINQDFYFVDLPGYGYAQVSKQQQSAWGQMIDRYLRERTTLSLIIQLLDIRHKPTHLDLQMWEYIQVTGMPGLLVATKTDKIARGQWQKHLRVIKRELGLDDAYPLLPFSAQDGTGKETIWQAITEHLSQTGSP